MKKLFVSAKENIVTGIAIIIPVAVIVILLTDVLKKLVAATEPVTSKMHSDAILLKTIVAIALVAAGLSLLFLIVGLFYKTYLGRSMSSWMEKKVLAKVPFYKQLKNLTRELVGIENANHPIVEVDLYGSGTKQIGLHTDTLQDGRCVVYLPFSPIINMGQLHLVAKENVKVLDIPLKAATDIITRLGFGANDQYKVKRETDSV